MVFDSTDVSIGGTAAGTGNTIAFNASGVDISPGGLHDPVRGNRIFSNSGGLGIDLGLFDGVTPNDTLDADSGANALQNFPILNSAVTDAGATAIAGVLDSAPNASFSVDLYASSACDVSGNGEGERPIGTVAVNTDGAGHAAFAFAASPEIPAGQLVTATATSADANTSEFSACRGVTVPPAPPPDPPAAQAPVTEPPRDDPAPAPVVVQTPPAVLPTKLPAASLTAPRKLRLGQLRAVAVTFAPDSDGAYIVGGFIAVPGLKGKAREFKPRSGMIERGQRAKIKLIPPRKLVAAARTALRKRKSLEAELAVTLRGPTGQVRTLKRKIQIVR